MVRFPLTILPPLCGFHSAISLGSLAKGHYTDWVDNPAEYPLSGMGGANVGPEFTAAEYLALQDLETKEKALCRQQPGKMPSRFMQTLEQAVIASGRWKKWLHRAEQGKDFYELEFHRRLWLVQTGARYIWTEPRVQAARQQLFSNLKPIYSDPHGYVVDKIVASIERYINAFNLFSSLNLLEDAHSYPLCS